MCQVRQGNATVEAERFVLQDKQGRTRAILQTTNNVAEFSLYGDLGPQSETKVDVETAAKVSLSNRQSGSLDLLLGSKEGPAIRLMDTGIGGRLFLADLETEKPRLLLRGRDEPGAVLRATGPHAELTSDGLSPVK